MTRSTRRKRFRENKKSRYLAHSCLFRTFKFVADLLIAIFSKKINKETKALENDISTIAAHINYNISGYFSIHFTPNRL
ncbi:hypothetical protein T07_14596 [Trichinella nelsoni]|uniref:Uncharacterized protein n=1 Tax=Trichinella nelsoni TaxID=6336 RepID=A0A0V0S1M7_9BILA|nr:hypothetical protein T07_14596 [Trichinella nelsoni]